MTTHYNLSVSHADISSNVLAKLCQSLFTIAMIVDIAMAPNHEKKHIVWTLCLENNESESFLVGKVQLVEQTLIAVGDAVDVHIHIHGANIDSPASVLLPLPQAAGNVTHALSKNLVS